MAREAGAVFPADGSYHRFESEELERFAALVASAEREACAKLADEWAVNWPHPAKTIALDIRARP
jgi:hypothetical protein